MATPSRAQHTVPPQDVAPVFVVGSSGRVPGQAASGCSSPAEVGDSGQVAPVSLSMLGGSLGQVASDTSSPVASTSLLVATMPSGGGSGQVASEPSSPQAPMVAASPVLGGEFGQVVHALPSPSLPPAQPCGARQTSEAMVCAYPLPGESDGVSVQADRARGWGEAGGRTSTRISREEVIALGGIQDPMSEGRRVSGRL